MKRAFEYLDYIAPTIGFEHNDSPKFRSVYGAFFSLSAIIASVIIGAMFGKEIYERKIPVVASSEEYVDESLVYLKNLPIVFSFKTDTSNFVDIEDYFDIQIDHITVDETRVNRKDQSLKIEECNFSKFNQHGKIFEDNRKGNLLKSYCMTFKEDTFLRNNLGTINSKYMRLNFFKCGEKYKNKKCAEDMNDIVLILSIGFINSYIDSSDYKEPVKYFEDYLHVPLSSKVQKANYLLFTNDVFYSDNGWILEDIKKIDYIALSNTYPDINLLPDDMMNKIYALILQSPQLRKKTTRNYMKVQELFAKIGGIANMFTIMVKILSYSFLRYKYLMYISENLENKDKPIFQHNISLISNNMVESKNEKSVKEKEKEISEANNFSRYDRSKSDVGKLLRLNKLGTKQRESVDTNKVISKFASPSIAVKKEIKNDDGIRPSEGNIESCSGPVFNKLKSQYLNNDNDDISKSYWSYLKGLLFCKKKNKEFFNKEFSRVKNILDIKIFTQYLNQVIKAQ